MNCEEHIKFSLSIEQIFRYVCFRIQYNYTTSLIAVAYQ